MSSRLASNKTYVETGPIPGAEGNIVGIDSNRSKTAEWGPNETGGMILLILLRGSQIPMKLSLKGTFLSVRDPYFQNTGPLKHGGNHRL